MIHYMRATPIERIRAKYFVDDNGCWVWIACRNSTGYGSVKVAGRAQLAHRVAYEILAGKIPEGKELDHLCRNRACVNPAHLEPVTGKVNVLRGAGVAARNAVKTHCAKGHEFTPENTTIRKPFGRDCKTCHKAWMRKWYQSRKSA